MPGPRSKRAATLLRSPQHSKVSLNLQTLNRHLFGELLAEVCGFGIMPVWEFVRCLHMAVAPLAAARTGEREDQ